MVFADEDRQKMDNAAADAQNALMAMELDDKTMSTLGNWWRDNIKAGHKRLGRIILEFADKNEAKKR